MKPDAKVNKMEKILVIAGTAEIGKTHRVQVLAQEIKP